MSPAYLIFLESLYINLSLLFCCLHCIIKFCWSWFVEKKVIPCLRCDHSLQIHYTSICLYSFSVQIISMNFLVIMYSKEGVCFVSGVSPLLRFTIYHYFCSLTVWNVSWNLAGHDVVKRAFPLCLAYPLSLDSLYTNLFLLLYCV